MTLERMVEWISKNYPPDSYFTVDDLIRDVEQRFNQDGHDMNDNIRQLLMDEFTKEFSPEYREFRERQEERQRIAELIGSGEIPQSMTDQMVETLENPIANFLGIDVTEYSTTREEVVPPEIKKFVQQQRPNALSRLVNKFIGFFRR